jgi:hypothetical protein
MVDGNKTNSESNTRARKRRRGRFLFWSINILALLLAIPLLKLTWPLLEIAWKTRSSRAIELNIHHQESLGGTASGDIKQSFGQVADTGDPASLDQLASKLESLEDLDEDALNLWAKRLFDGGIPPADPSTFDLDSAVFSRIEREIKHANGQTLYVYWIELVDINGNKAYRMASSAEPDTDYERSIQTLQLIKENPELQKIYSAFSHAIATSSNSSREVSEDEENAR